MIRVRRPAWRIATVCLLFAARRVVRPDPHLRERCVAVDHDADRGGLRCRGIAADRELRHNDELHRHRPARDAGCSSSTAAIRRASRWTSSTPSSR